MRIRNTLVSSAVILGLAGLLGGCGSGDNPANAPAAPQPVAKATATPEPVNQSLPHAVEVTMVSPFEFRVNVTADDPSRAVTTIRGTLTLDSAPDQPIVLDQKTPGQYASGAARADVPLPAKGKARLLVDNYMEADIPVNITAITKVDDPQFAAPLGAGEPPKATEARRGFQHGADEAAFAVLGENLQDAKLYFRAGTSEKEIPYDDRTSTGIVVQDATILDLVPAGTYDVLVRSAHGESVLEGAFTRAE